MTQPSWRRSHVLVQGGRTRRQPDLLGCIALVALLLTLALLVLAVGYELVMYQRN